MFLAKDIDKWHDNVKAETKLVILLLKSITLANIAKFFLLPAMIWNKNSENFEKQLNFTLVMAYYLYGLIQVYSGLQISSYQSLGLTFL